MNELTKRIVSCVLLLIIGLGCFFGISGWQSSPETHRTSIEYLNEKQATVMKLTAASTAASAAVSALPGDTGSAIAEKLADLTSDFLIVLCAIMLEKYLLTITGYAVFSVYFTGSVRAAHRPAVPQQRDSGEARIQAGAVRHGGLACRSGRHHSITHDRGHL